MKKLLLVFALLMCVAFTQAQSDSTAIIMMSVYEGTGSGNNNRISVSYPGSSRADEFILLERLRLFGNPHKNQQIIAESINKIVLMGYKLDKFEMSPSMELARRHSTYIFVREEK